jgi:ABC-type branched-subunit amino acid transport system ATPase component
MTPVLAARGIDVVLAGMPVLTDVSIDVGRGEIVALLGRNGAGKTTTLRALAGLQRVAGGRVLLDGRAVQNRPAHRVAAAGCALVLEGARVFRRLRVIDNLRLGAPGATHREVASRLAEQLDRFPMLAARANALAGQLSGGEQSLLALAQGLMAAPRVLLVDEPSVGLDPGTAHWVFSELAKLRDEGWAMIVAEQAVDGVLGVADRGCVLDVGRVVATGAAPALRDDPAVRAAYIGPAAPRG